MKRLAIAAVLLVASVAGAWSDDLPAVPAPEGFVESSVLLPALKDQALMGHPAGTRLIGVYLLPDELANILHGGPVRMTFFCRAYVNEEFPTEEDAKALFLRIVEVAKREAANKFELDDPDVRRIIKRFEELTKERQGQSVSITGATALGSIWDTENVCAQSLIVAASTQTEQGQVSIPMTAAVAWLRWGKQILELSDLAQFQGDESIRASNKVLVQWVTALPALSPADLR